MSEEKKKANLPYEFPYFFEDFLVENDEEFETSKTNVYIDNDGLETEGDEMEGSELVEWLETNNKELFDKFADYLYEKISNSELPISDSEYPAWSYFDDSPTIVKNQWLIHFTNDAYSIANNGFKYGVYDMTKLGLTTSLGEFYKKYGGYNFAYLLGDFDRYAKNRHGYKYGEEAVVFRASGIKTWHYGDQEPQVIFYGNTATNIIPVTKGESGNWEIVNKKTDNVLFSSDELQKVADWIESNYEQYRKNL